MLKSCDAWLLLLSPTRATPPPKKKTLPSTAAFAVIACNTDGALLVGASVGADVSVLLEDTPVPLPLPAPTTAASPVMATTLHGRRIAVSQTQAQSVVGDGAWVFVCRSADGGRDNRAVDGLPEADLVVGPVTMVVRIANYAALTTLLSPRDLLSAVDRVRQSVRDAAAEHNRCATTVLVRG